MKNTYLFKAKYYASASEIVKSLTDAFLSSAEETMFGDWLERLAVFICNEVYGGVKSSAKGIDIEFDKEGVRYIVSVKSGPNWGNSSQIAKLKSDFISAKRSLNTSGARLNIQAVNGCCYGIDNKPDKGDYLKYCGQDFWFFISGCENLYIDIIEPLATDAKQNNDSFIQEYNKMLNLFTKEFIDEFCYEDGEVDWSKLLVFNSGSQNITKI